MKFFVVLLIFLSFSAQAESTTGFVTIKKILTWTNGNFKAYVNEKSEVLNKEGCTATDGSVAMKHSSETAGGEKNILAQLMYAEASKKKVKITMNGCCLNHNKKMSPCIESVTGF